MFLVIGAKGQLGCELRARLQDRADYADLDELDITRESAVAAFLRQRTYDAVINCAAYNAVDKAEDDPAAADAVNHLGPLYLARYARRLIHISSDYVFSGESSRPYLETDATGPLSVYGRTKLAGEQAVLTTAASVVLIRTSWLYSIYGNNFLKTMLRLGAEKDSLRVVFDQVGTPTYAGHLAAGIVDLLPRLADDSHELYHYSNEGVCSWYDFAVAIMALSGRRCRVQPIRSHEYPTRARRPAFSVLDKAKIKGDLAWCIPHWQEGLTTCLQQFS